MSHWFEKSKELTSKGWYEQSCFNISSSWILCTNPDSVIIGIIVLQSFCLSYSKAFIISYFVHSELLTNTIIVPFSCALFNSFCMISEKESTVSPNLSKNSRKSYFFYLLYTVSAILRLILLYEKKTVAFLLKSFNFFKILSSLQSKSIISRILSLDFIYSTSF